MQMKRISFTNEEETRRKYIRLLEKLSSRTFDAEKWEKLRNLVYSPRPLDVDVVIDDTTLRDGLQMAGLSYASPPDVCHIASLLRDIGVERIEVMTYTQSDQKAIKLMQDEGLGKLLAAWCRAVNEDIDLALKLGFKSIGISHPVSNLHFEKWPGKTLKQLVERVVNVVQYARDHDLEVFVHGEDSTRADWAFEKKFINAVANVGAKVYRICDTVGCGSSDPRTPLPTGIPAKIKRIQKETTIPYVEIHTHDDLGNAVENTMAAVRAASGLYDKVYVSTTFLGIGDRAGNAETEKIIMNCYLHHNLCKWNLKPLRETANYIASALNYHLPLNKAIVGDSAFAHESGIHLHGIMTLPLTYEIFPPELVGHERAIVIGKRSGKHGIQMKVEGITGDKVSAEDPRIAKLVEMIKNEYLNSERKYSITGMEFEELVRKVGFKIKRRTQ